MTLLIYFMLTVGVELDELVSERKMSFVFFSVAYPRNELSHFALGHYTSLGLYTTLCETRLPDAASY